MELPFQQTYHWTVRGRGCANPPNDDEPNGVISTWEINIEQFDEDDEDETNPHLIGKIEFSVVNLGEAVNRGEALEEVFDAEDEFHFDYYEHAKSCDDGDEMLSAYRTVLLTEDDIAAIPLVHRFNVLRILENLFAETVIAVFCKDVREEVAVHLSTVLDRLPNLHKDPHVGWLYHDSRYQWILPDAQDAS